MDKRITWKVLAYEKCDECKKAGEKDEYPYNQDLCRLVHTEGFKDIGHPEIATVLNVDPAKITMIFNSMGLEIVEGKRRFDNPDDYEEVVANGYTVRIVKYDGDDMLYMFLPDENNKFPGDKGCGEGFKLQDKYAKAISKIRIRDKEVPSWEDSIIMPW